MRQRFECQEGTSSKFWEIEIKGSSITTWWGRIGAAGQTKTKEFDLEAKAQTEYKKLVGEKTAKGYSEIVGLSTDAARDYVPAQLLSPELSAFVQKLVAISDRDNARSFLFKHVIDENLETLDNTTAFAQEFFFWWQSDFDEPETFLVEAIEKMLKTGHLSAQVVDVTKLEINYNGKRKTIMADSDDLYNPHLIICAVNKLLQGNYELRFCIDSPIETHYYLPLSATGWRSLEELHGANLKLHFYKIAEKPDLFTVGSDYDDLKFDADGKLDSRAALCRMVAFAVRDINTGEVIQGEDFRESAVNLELAKQQWPAVLSGVGREKASGARATTIIKKGAPIRSCDIEK